MHLQGLPWWPESQLLQLTPARPGTGSLARYAATGVRGVRWCPTCSRAGSS